MVCTKPACASAGIGSYGKQSANKYKDQTYDTRTEHHGMHTCTQPRANTDRQRNRNMNTNRQTQLHYTGMVLIWLAKQIADCLLQTFTAFGLLYQDVEISIDMLIAMYRVFPKLVMKEYRCLSQSSYHGCEICTVLLIHANILCSLWKLYILCVSSVLCCTLTTASGDLC